MVPLRLQAYTACMTYNIHPIFVHFPIALLFSYAVIKILPMRRLVPRVSWVDVERILLLLGVLGAFVALSTGETAEHLVRPNEALVEAHAALASLSTWVFGALLFGQILVAFHERVVPRLRVEWFTKLWVMLERLLAHRVVSTVLAVIGLVAISLTGMLGGVMVYGASADPFAPILLKILGISLGA